MVKRRKKIPNDQRKRVLERDRDRCVLCWRWHGLDIHHFQDVYGGILPPNVKSLHGMFHSPNVASPNDYDLITLCDSCHGKIETCDTRSPIYQLLGSIVRQNFEKWLPVCIEGIKE